MDILFVYLHNGFKIKITVPPIDIKEPYVFIMHQRGARCSMYSIIYTLYTYASKCRSFSICGFSVKVNGGGIYFYFPRVFPSWARVEKCNDDRINCIICRPCSEKEFFSLANRKFLGNIFTGDKFRNVHSAPAMMTQTGSSASTEQ